MDKLKNCTLPEKANHCTAAKCSQCGWDRTVLAARRRLLTSKGLTHRGDIEYLALPKKENTDEKEQ